MQRQLPMPALLAIAMVVALSASACKRSEPTDSTQSASTAATTPGAQTPPPEATQPPTAPAATANTPPAATQPDVPATSNGFDLNVAQSADHGKYLVDATGKTVYALAKDSSTTSTCQGACTTQWPPLIAQGQPKTMDPSLDDSAVGVIQRGDGTQQVTYGGHPLYHYAQDTAAGQLNGADKHDEYGDWSLLSPEGTPIASH